jgi:hypothetical protein
MPWALGAGALGVLGVLAAHMLSRQRPRALALATARFLPSGMLEATTVQKVPMDRWWMLLRMLIIALLALGVAQPVPEASRVPTRTVLLLDRSLPLDAQRAATAILSPADVMVAYDTTALLSIGAGSPGSRSREGRLSAGLARLVRVRDSLAKGTAQLRVVVASRFASRSLDTVTQTLRAMIPDSITVLPLAVKADSVIARGPITVRAEGDDPIAATALLLGDSVAPAGAVIQRGLSLTDADTAAARNGATVVWWPARTAVGTPALQGLTVGSATWIAPIARDSAADATTGRPIGWWADGSVAARADSVGKGCLIDVRASLPSAGDQTLSLAAQAWLAALVTSCDGDGGGVQAPPAWLSPPPPRVVDAPSVEVLRRSSLAPWFIGAALVLALVELLLRLRRTA